MQFTKEQEKALEYLKNKENIFLTGGAGTGKSFVLREYITYCKSNNLNVVACAYTGIAANNIGGITAHKLFRLRFDYETRTPRSCSDIVKLADVIIIDEISMLRMDYFDFIIETIKVAEEKTGKKKQVILSGDFFQLPPILKGVDKVLEEHYKKKKLQSIGNLYAFQSFYFHEFKIVELNEIVRQKDKDFAEALNKIRYGEKEGIDWINEHCANEQFDNAMTITHSNRHADQINMENLVKLPASTEKEYTMWTRGIVRENDTIFMKTLTLREGARVMMLSNDANGKYVNGTCGVVHKLNDNSVDVFLLPFGDLVTIGYTNLQYIYEYEVVNGKIEKNEIGAFSQIPLKLAYAVTTHKSQGQTYDRANITPAGWAAGLLYTALSRVKTIDGLYLTNPLTEDMLSSDDDVFNFYQAKDNYRYDWSDTSRCLKWDEEFEEGLAKAYSMEPIVLDKPVSDEDFAKMYGLDI